MLKQRVITALLLLLLLLSALFAPVVWPFKVLMGVTIGLGGWEWARLSGYGPRAGAGWAALAIMLCAGMAALGWTSTAAPAVRWLVTLAGVLWIVVGAWLLHVGVGVWQSVPAFARMLAGLMALCCAWLATVQLHGRFGVWYLLSVLALVWAADIAAYFSGRAFGRRKLAPTISPGKSWAGVYGGMVAALLLALACSLSAGVPNLYAALSTRSGPVGLVLAVMVLVAMSVVGDLVESLMKRSMGLKDSSQLLPGHGGVLDRIDGLLPVLPLALAVTLWLEY